MKKVISSCHKKKASEGGLKPAEKAMVIKKGRVEEGKLKKQVNVIVEKKKSMNHSAGALGTDRIRTTWHSQ